MTCNWEPLEEVWGQPGQEDTIQSGTNAAYLYHDKRMMIM